MPGGRPTVYKPENAEMTRALAWIRAREAGQISREDVRRDAFGQALNAHQSLQVIQSLERGGFLRRAEVDYAGNGRPALRCAGTSTRR